MYMKSFGEWILCGVRWNKIIVYDCNGHGRVVGVIHGLQGIAKKFLVVPLKKCVLLVAMTMTNKICIYDLDQQGFPLQGELCGHTGVIADIATSTSFEDPLSPDSRGLLVSSAEDLTVRLWDIVDEICIRIFDGKVSFLKIYLLWPLFFAGLAGFATSVAFCSNHVVSLGQDKYLRVWNINEDRPMRRELLSIENPLIMKFDGSRIFFRHNADVFTYDIYEGRYDGFITVTTPFTLVGKELVYVYKENIVQYDLSKKRMAMIPTGKGPFNTILSFKKDRLT